MTPAQFCVRNEAGQGPKIVRLLVGNALIIKEMAKTVPEPSIQVQFRQRARRWGPAALAVVRNLDAKMEGLLETTRGDSAARV